MSKPIKDGGAAFPGASVYAGEEHKFVNIGGMTLRDYFAGQALAGMMSGLEPCRDDCRCKSHVPDARYAEEAYDVADAMLAQRELAKGGGDE